MIEVIVTATNYQVSSSEITNPVTVTADNSLFTVTSVVSNFTVTNVTPQFTFSTDGGAGFDFATKHTGEWISGTQYARNDVVRYQYSIYICNIATTATLVSSTPPPIDPTNWELFTFNEWPRAYLTVTDFLSVGGPLTAASTATFNGAVSFNGNLLSQGNATFNNLAVNEQFSINGLNYPKSPGLYGQVLTTNGVTTATWVNLGELVFWSLSNDLLTNGFNIVTGTGGGGNPQLTIGSGTTGDLQSYLKFNTNGTIEVKGATSFLNAIQSSAGVSGASGAFGTLNITNTAQFGGLTTHNGGIRFADGSILTSTNVIIGGTGTNTGTVSIPTASASVLGVVRVGQYLTIDGSGILSVNTATLPGNYVLPVASASTLGGIKVGTGLEIAPGGVLNFIGTTTVAVGFVDLDQPMNTNGNVIRYSAANPNSYVDVNANDVTIGANTATIRLGFVDSEYQTKITDARKIELSAPNLVFGEQNTGTVKIGTLYVNRIYNYAGTFAPFFPAGVQFQDNTVQRTAYEPDGGLIP